MVEMSERTYEWTKKQTKNRNRQRIMKQKQTFIHLFSLLRKTNENKRL